MVGKFNTVYRKIPVYPKFRYIGMVEYPVSIYRYFRYIGIPNSPTNDIISGNFDSENVDQDEVFTI